MLDIQVTGSGTVTASLQGELVMEHAAKLRSVLTALLNRGDVTGINLDLANVTLIDATGAGTLIVAQRIAANLRVLLQLTAASPATIVVLTLMDATSLLPV